MPDVCVVIPTYNEAENIENIINKVLTVAGSSVIVVDDGSPDGTSEVVEKIAQRDPRVRLLNRGRKMGLGSAYRDGFRLALESKADVIVSMDADGSHPPELIPRLVKALGEDADVAVASRYVSGGSWSAGRGRMVVSRGANLLARVCTGVRLRDMTSGFRAYRSRAVESLIGEEFPTGYVFQVEAIYRLVRRGFKVVEIPFIFTERVSGRSKLSTVEIIRFITACLKILASRITGEDRR
ncbi:MAG: polyprenol monophosphomannose synthase [Candidatus Caldarchaeum sp.]